VTEHARVQYVSGSFRAPEREYEKTFVEDGATSCMCGALYEDA